ncbi:transmembrane protein 198-like [Plakobranchus ocellatus]|uniref:Transmembrane protein 198 n=1 Tax=Plakobranchus ocellatus TaxID=259542 RepID=A0AAV3XV30_9GAST|nr:transmembrane protein 198-like [Plakobranchus ocellatus]
MAVASPTNFTPAIFSEIPNATDDGPTTGDEDLSVYNTTVPWSGFDPAEPAHSCSLRFDYGVVAGILAVVCFLFGILYTFLGYRFLKAVLFLTGFLLATVLLYMILEEQGNLLPPEGTLACAVGAGILLGLLSMLIPYVGLVLTGFSLGAGAAAAAMVVVEQFTHPPTRWISWGVFLLLGLIFGILGLKFPKGITIAGTSVIGSAVGLAGVDYFLELSRASLYLWDRLMTTWSSQMCWYSWLMLALWPVVTILGMLVQWKCTGADVDHHIALHNRREQSVHLHQTKARERREIQQTRYRHLYQARRVRGDVISQNYIQSIQHKLSPAMQSLTALNVEANPEEESTATTTLTQVT